MRCFEGSQSLRIFCKLVALDGLKWGGDFKPSVADSETNGFGAQVKPHKFLTGLDKLRQGFGVFQNRHGSP